MVASQFLKARVSPEVKRLVQTASRRELLTESIWLKRLVLTALRDIPGPARSTSSAPKRNVSDGASSHGGRLYIRLRSEDSLLLKERSAARSLRPATYVSVLIRSHLRSLSPLPKDELVALKRAVAELGAIGRNLNQIARAANQGRLVGPQREDLRAMLKVCEALRDNMKGAIKANVNSWEIGHVESER